jgi:hypothetical protein
LFCGSHVFRYFALFSQTPAEIRGDGIKEVKKKHPDSECLGVFFAAGGPIWLAG